MSLFRPKYAYLIDLYFSFRRVELAFKKVTCNSRTPALQLDRQVTATSSICILAARALDA